VYGASGVTLDGLMALAKGDLISDVSPQETLNLARLVNRLQAVHCNSQGICQPRPAAA